MHTYIYVCVWVLHIDRANIGNYCSIKYLIFEVLHCSHKRHYDNTQENHRIIHAENQGCYTPWRIHLLLYTLVYNILGWKHRLRLWHRDIRKSIILISLWSITPKSFPRGDNSMIKSTANFFAKCVCVWYLATWFFELDIHN